MYTRLTPTKVSLFLLVGILFTLISSLAGIWHLREERLWMQLNSVGQKTQGQLLDSYSSRSNATRRRKSTTDYYLAYQFTLPNKNGVKETFQKEEEIPRLLYFQLQSKPQGTAIPVVYLPNNPDSARIMRERRTFQPGFFLWFLPLGVFLAIGSALIARLFVALLGLCISISLNEIKQTVWVLAVVFLIPICTCIWLLSGVSA